MCGIAGFVGAGGSDVLRRMTGALTHRGPDAEGTACDPERGVWLGHRRLAVVDLESGEQPMWTAERDLVVVYNGEVYNAPELRAGLEARGHAFRSHHSDTEVLLHGWREWGPALVERLDGMWAFALYDRRAGRLFLSRDRFGEKPLYWTQRAGAFAFASELSALTRHPCVERSLDPLALRKYWGHGYVPAPRAVYRGVQKLPAGHNLVFDLRDASARLSRWWRLALEPDPALAERPLESLCEELRERLERAVARRLVADVPVGVFLSGGIDSSAVAVFAARHLKPGGLRTISVGFEEPSFDESGFAAAAARHVGSRHHCSTFTLERARALLPQLAERLDEPLADASLLPTHLLCGAARREVTVALGGDGGDELFAGYDPFRALWAAERWSRLVPRPVHRALRLLASRLPVSHAYMSTGFRVQRALAGLEQRPALWNPVWLAPLGPAELGELLDEPVDAEEIYSEAIEAWEQGRGASSVDRTLQFFSELYLQNGVLAKLDRASMMHSLEVRSPFLDRELVDFARRLPWQLKLHGRRTKFLLRRALAPLLPREVLERPKQGFGVPVGAWIRAGAAPFDAWPRPGAEGASATRFRQRRLAEHRAGRADHRLFLYADWLLGRWLARPGADW
jgi:asparagine synthase (glutamine-hydrolysing)